MSVFSEVWDIFRQHRDSSFAYDLDLWEPEAHRIYLRRMAVDTVANFVARSFAQSEFKVMRKDTAKRNSELYYRLNVQPNPNQSASEFWQELIYHLLVDGEVLAVQTDTGDLVIADSFSHDERALYPDTFSGVTVGTYTYQRSFSMDDVLYLTYSNAPLSRYVSGLFQDTSELYGRMYQAALRDKQIRGIVKVGAMTGTEAKKQATLQNYINTIFKQYRNRSVAIVPTPAGLDYEETNTQARTSGDSPASMLTTLKQGLIDDIAQLVGVPPVLLHGQQAQIDQAQQMYLDYCLRPLEKRIEAAGNALWFTKAEYQHGNHLDIVGLDRADVMKLAESLDKLRAGGFITGDQGLVMLGLDPTGKPEMQEYYVTKNYDSASNNSGTSSTDAGAESNKEGENADGKDSD